MGHINLSPSRRPSSHPSLLSLTSLFLLSLLLLFLFLTFTPLGDSLAHSGRITLASSSNPVSTIPPCSISFVDYMPCEDPQRSSHFSRDMNFYRERHCPSPQVQPPLCLIPPPKGYRIPVPWPQSLHKIWHENMPYGKIAERKGHQGWMKQEGEYFLFPGGGTMFPDGAEQYIDKLSRFVPIKSGQLRTALDMGCGVASFGGYMLQENILTVSFAPRDSHKSQIQFALERGIPAFVAMLGTRRLPFPAQAFDLVHCSRCLIPFTAYNGTYLIEADRLLRPGGYLIISGPPVQWPNQESQFADLQSKIHSLCYELITIESNTAIWHKPSDSPCQFTNQEDQENQESDSSFSLCTDSDDPDKAWYTKLKKCVNKVELYNEISVGNLRKWPERSEKASERVMRVKNGVEFFEVDSKRWVRRVNYYKNVLNVKFGDVNARVRNVMDMNAIYGGFAKGLLGEQVWVMNVVPDKERGTLGAVFDRGFIGVYHDWCEPFSTYPRTYDLLHVSGINSLVSNKNGCHLVDVLLEMDRILRPEGKAIIRDSEDVINKVSKIVHGFRWTAEVYDSEPGSSGSERILVATKTFWKLE